MSGVVEASGFVCRSRRYERDSWELGTIGNQMVEGMDEGDRDVWPIMGSVLPEGLGAGRDRKFARRQYWSMFLRAMSGPWNFSCNPCMGVPRETRSSSDTNTPEGDGSVNLGIPRGAPPPVTPSDWKNLPLTRWHAVLSVENQVLLRERRSSGTRRAG